MYGNEDQKQLDIYKEKLINAEETVDQQKQDKLEEGVREHQQDKLIHRESRIFDQNTVDELVTGQQEQIVHPEYELNFNLVEDYTHLEGAPVLTEKDTLSEAALNEQRKWRDYITRKFRFDDLKRQSIHDQDLTLRQVVDTYFDNEEKLRIAHTTEAHFKEFQNIKKSIINDKVLTAEEKAKTLYNMTRIFAGDFAKYRVLYADNLAPGKRKDKINDLLDLFDKLMKLYDPDYEWGEALETDKTDLFNTLGITDESHEEAFGSGDSIMLKLRDRVRFLNKGKRQQKTPEQLEKEKADEKILSENLTEEQRRRLLQTDYLLVKVAAKHTDHISFLNKVLELPPRKRLYMYYVIQQKGHLESPGYFDAGLSQMGYVPDVKVIEDRLTKVPYRVWEVMSPDGLHSFMWEKVEAAYAQIQREDVAKNVLAYAKMQGVTADSILEEKREKKKEELGQEGLDEQVDKELKREADEVFGLERERDALLLKALQAAQECHEAVMDRDNASFVTKWYKKKTADQKASDAQDAMRALRVKDKALADKTEFLMEKNYKVGFKEEESKLKADAVYVSSQSLTLLSKVSLVPKLFSDPIKTIGVTQGMDARIDLGLLPNADISLNGLLKGVNYSAGVLGTLSGCVNLYASLKGVSNALKMIKSEDFATDVTMVSVLKAGRGVAAGAYGICAGITNISYASRVSNLMMGDAALATAVGAMKSGMQVAGGAISTAGLVLDVADVFVQGRQEYHRLKALSKFHDIKKTLRRDQTEDSQSDVIYIENMVKLDRRNKVRAAISTAASMTSNGVGLAAAITTSAGAGIGLALGAVAVSLGAKLLDYKLKGYNKNTTVEEFLKMDDLEWLNLPKDIKLTKKVKKQIMEHMAAEMGYTTVKGMFNHIVRKYATFIYNHLFFRGDKAIFFSKPEGDQMVDACYEFVEGLGLHIEFPTSSANADSERHPSLATLCARLGC